MEFTSNTCFPFAQWCGAYNGKTHHKLVKNKRIYENDLFLEFIDDCPDYAKGGSSKISRQEFGKWLSYYSEYKYQCKPLSDRDMIGKWVEFVNK